jgi:hypothetical protein
VLFEIKQMHPEIYRRETRRSTLVVVLIFVLLAMSLATLAVRLFGEPGADNFRLNLGGVLVGLLLTVALVRTTLWSKPWMAAAVYGWQLKRNLMRITNVMHQLTPAVAAGDPQAMQLLRFYHLGVTQMQQLDGNASDHSQLILEIDRHKEVMQARGLELEQYRLDPAWIEALKKAA